MKHCFAGVKRGHRREGMGAMPEFAVVVVLYDHCVSDCCPVKALKAVTVESSWKPLDPSHHDALVKAAEDGAIWNLWYNRVPTPDGMRAEIESRLKLQTQGSMIPFTTPLIDTEQGIPGQVIGMTTYMNIDAATPRVEIGSTWNARSSNGTGTNPESKLLLLQHAFDVMGCPTVEFRTHWLNPLSRQAISRLGAKEDGVLRCHPRTADGTLRDIVVYSVLQSERPMVRNGLQRRVEKHQETHNNAGEITATVPPTPQRPAGKKGAASP